MATATGQGEYPEIKLYIDGQWTDGAGSRGDDVVNPATEEALGRVPFAEPGDVAAAIAAAKEAFPQWRDAGPDVRSGILLKAAALLHQRADEIGRVMTMEEGKPLAEAAGEVHRAATGLQWNTEEGRRAYGRIIPSGPDEILSVRVVPVGPVGAFVPWNFPAGGPMRKISAALAATSPYRSVRLVGWCVRMLSFASTSVTGTFQRCAAAAFSRSRALAPAC